MHKVTKAIILLFFSISLIGCTDKNVDDDKVDINFKVMGVVKTVEVTKGTVITKDMVPVSDLYETFELYYDMDYREVYNNEAIYDDVTIYVKIIILPPLENEINQQESLLKFLKKNSCKKLIRYKELVMY